MSDLDLVVTTADDTKKLVPVCDIVYEAFHKNNIPDLQVQHHKSTAMTRVREARGWKNRGMDSSITHAHNNALTDYCVAKWPSDDTQQMNHSDDTESHTS